MSDLNRFAPADDRNSREIVRDRIEMVAAVFGKKISEQMVVVFQDALEKYPNASLKRAFSRAETILERFPTPKVMRELCNAEVPRETWRYNFKPGTDHEGVDCLIDPDPDCYQCREPHSKHPTPNCTSPVDDGRARFMYRPQNCPEGQIFLSSMKRMAGK